MQKGVNIVFEFLSTPSARRATCSGRRPRPAWTDFYPRPPRGGRHGVCAARHDSLLFLSTPSARRATQHSRFCYVVIQFLSTPSARRATRTRRQMVSGSSNFYPRPPRGGRPSTPGFATLSYNFYPRPPRGGRPGLGDKWFQDHQISIHALREEGDPALPVLLRCHTISIHALREEGDQDSETNGFRIIKFLSTPSARRATRTRRQMVSGSSNFYPRPPRGGRPLARLVRADGTLFLSTPSARRATHPPVGGGDVEGISIHVLREEGDVRKGRKMQWYGSFLSTPSARRAT